MQKLVPAFLISCRILITAAPLLQIFQTVGNTGMIGPVLILVSIIITPHIDQLIRIVFSVRLEFRPGIQLIQDIPGHGLHPVFKLSSGFISALHLLKRDQIPESCRSSNPDKAHYTYDNAQVRQNQKQSLACRRIKPFIHIVLLSAPS